VTALLTPFELYFTTQSILVYGGDTMRVKYIGCASSKNEVEWLGFREEIDYEFLDYSYHANPRKLHQKLKEVIDNSQEYNLIILGYGRCSNALIGLISPKVPMILPRTHDCLGLLLGSNEKYVKIARGNIGTYFFSQGWLDYGRNPFEEYLEYKTQYGVEKARILIESLYGRYTKALLITTPGMKDINRYREKVRQIADFFGWSVEEVKGDMSLLTSLITGNEGSGTVYIKPGQVVHEDIFWQE